MPVDCYKERDGRTDNIVTPLTDTDSSAGKMPVDCYKERDGRTDNIVTPLTDTDSLAGIVVVELSQRVRWMNSWYHYTCN